jgi:DNA-directed RNA polymerase subunit RPC12/RpoP
MRIQTKYFKKSATVVAVRCECGQSIVHDLRKLEIRCFSCGNRQLFDDALDELLVSEQRPDAPIFSEVALRVG